MNGNSKRVSLRKIIGLALVVVVENLSSSANASDLNADAVINKMNAEQRFSYVAGVIEGLSYARYVKDAPNEAGMKCIRDWFYKDNSKLWLETLFPVFKKHNDKSVGVIVYVLTKKECGV